VGIGVVISEHVVVKGDVIIGDGCFIDVGAIIGAEGLLYYKDADANRRISHRGGVVIGTNATILANAVVAQGIHPGRPTVVGEHAIVGIATNVGHEAVLGKNVVISGNCVIARGAQIGDGAWIGASATVREYVQVGERANVKAGSVVVEDVPAGSEVSGNFAIPHNRRILQYLREKK
jgi:UDP-3-O-[3-hydroxymyristoyl] glucosamine N-acyltransferase